MRRWYVNGDRLWTGPDSINNGEPAALLDKTKGTTKEENYAVAVYKKSEVDKQIDYIIFTLNEVLNSNDNMPMDEFYSGLKQLLLDIKK